MGWRSGRKWHLMPHIPANAGVFLRVNTTGKQLTQFKTYQEDAPEVDTGCAATVWVAFARFDAFALDEDGYDDSGRTVYVTTTEADANSVYDKWLDGGFNPNVEFSVRRGFVRPYPSVDDPELVDVLHASDDVGWSKELDTVFGF